MSGRSEEGGEKSFAPTPKRLEDARRRGDVPRSADLAAAAAYLGLLVAIAAFGAGAVRAAGSELAFFLGRPEQLQGRVLGAEGAGLLLLPLARAAAAILPFLMMPLAAAFLAHLAQGSFAASAEKLLPKLSRISPIANAAQKFGPTGLVAFAKSTVKMVAAAAVLGLFLADAMNEIIGSLRAPPALVGAEMMRLATGLLAAIAAIAVVIAAADWLWQRFDHARRLRMSFQEIRDEAREIEGDPHQKQARRRRAEEIARNRMLADVATDTEAAGALAARAADAVDAGDPQAGVLAAHAKKFATRVALTGLSQCMQVLGANGFRHDRPLARHLAAAKMAQYLDGTTEVQNIVIARGLFGR